MRVTFKLFASLTEYLPLQARYDNQIELELPEGTVVAELIERFSLPKPMVHLVLVNGSYIAAEHRASHALVDGDALAIWPPIAGG